MKKEEIISVLSELHKVTGFRMSLHDEHFNEICAYPKEKLPLCAYIQKNPREEARCIECDRRAFEKAINSGGPVIYRCPSGLSEAVSPLYNFGVLTGFLMMGQIFCKEDFDTSIYSTLIDEDAIKICESTPCVSREMLNSYVRIMTICAQYLTLSNAIQIERRGVAQKAKLFIELNLAKKLTIEGICENVECSKSTLTTAFKKEFSMTVNEFISSARIKRARELLSTGKYSVGEVADATGFYDQSYFAKVFTTSVGITPKEYKKNGYCEEQV